MCQQAAERGGYGGERYEKLEFQRKVAESYKVLHDASWKVIDSLYGLSLLPKHSVSDSEASFWLLVLHCFH